MNTHKSKGVIGIVILVSVFIGLTGLLFMVPMMDEPNATPDPNINFIEHNEQVLIEIERQQFTDELKIELRYDEKQNQIITTDKQIISVDKADSINVIAINGDRTRLINTHAF